MSKTRQGWTLLFFLIVISILTLLASNEFKISLTMASAARTRYRHHQELRLLEGLFTYGIHLCNENKALLFSWGAHTSQTMYLTFDPWPSRGTVALFGAYKGLLIITSQEGSINLVAQISRNGSLSMSGNCALRPLDPKNPNGGLLVGGWRMDSMVST